jgi:conjugal transfer pilus assembly protein TraA
MSTVAMYRGSVMSPGSLWTAYRKQSFSLQALLGVCAIVSAIYLLMGMAHATNGVEFAAAATQFETWVGGTLGKLAAFAALGIGAMVAAIRKDWSWFFGAVILSVGVGVITTVINASFTAIL